MLPGHVDHPAIGIDVGRTLAGQLVVLRVVVVMHPGIRGVRVFVGGHALDDHVLRVHLADTDVGEWYPVLPLAIFTRVGIIPPYRGMLRYRYAGGRRCAR